MAIIDKIQLSGTVYTIGNETTTAVTSASTDNEIPTAKAVYDAIPQGGGGKTVKGGTNISITTGETADTINCTLPIETIKNAYGISQIYVGDNIYKDNNYQAIVIASKDDSSTGKTIVEFAHGAISIGSSNKVFQNGIVIGKNSTAGASNSWNNIAIGYNTVASGTTKTNINNQIKVDDSNQVYIYNKDNTEMVCLQDQLGGGGSSYTAGDGIDINNDVISVTGKVDTTTYETYTAATDTALASKQTTLTAGTGISIVDNVISATGKVDTSAITTTITSSSTDSQVPSAKAVNDKLGGLSLVKLTQSEYDALSPNYDANTLYVING